MIAPSRQKIGVFRAGTDASTPGENLFLKVFRSDQRISRVMTLEIPNTVTRRSMSILPNAIAERRGTQLLRDHAGKTLNILVLQTLVRSRNMDQRLLKTARSQAHLASAPDRAAAAGRHLATLPSPPRFSRQSKLTSLGRARYVIDADQLIMLVSSTGRSGSPPPPGDRFPSRTSDLDGNPSPPPPSA